MLSTSRAGLILFLSYALILAVTRATVLGDTAYYANDIADHLGKTPFGAGNSLWDAAHLLWRPLGWLLTSLLSPLLTAVTDWTPAMQAAFCLIVISTVCSFVTLLLWHALLRDIMRTTTAPLLITLAMGFAHSILLYSHSGCSYITGLMLLTASLYFLRGKRLISGAVCYAAATLMWLPFILGGLALLIVAACPYSEESLKGSLSRFSLSWAAKFTAVSATAVLLVYGLAVMAIDVHSVEQARDWFLESSHQRMQNRNLLRAVTGLPRSVLYLGKDGILYKRYLWHDPYAQVTKMDLVRASLWKIGAFYAFCLALVAEILRRRQSGWPLLLFLAGAGPIVYFAIFVYEPGSPERYFPAFPFLIVAMGWVLRDLRQTRRITQFVIAGFLVCMVCANGYSFAASRVGRDDRGDLERVAALRSHFSGSGVAMVVTNQDRLEETLSHSLFNPINRPYSFPVYDLIEPDTARVLTWREQFAAVASGAWDKGAEVWVSKRAWAARPEPSWNWVEGDTPSVHWGDIPHFFADFETDGDEGGADGFVRLARSDRNRAALAPLAAAYSRIESGQPAAVSTDPAAGSAGPAR